MKDFFKLVFKFTSIMLCVIAVIIFGLWGYAKITGQKIDLNETPLKIFTEKETKTILVAGLHPEGPLTDFIMVVQYNPNTKRVVGLSIPRDTKVIGTVDGKINSAYARKRNINDLKEKVKEVTSISVDNYVIIDTKVVKKVVNAIGGVPINVPIDMKYDDSAQDLHIDIKKGQQVLNGDKAEEFIRFRKNNDGTGYANGDVQRTSVQQEFIKAAVKQLLSAKNITKIPELIQIAFDSVKTDIDIADAIKYVDDIKEFDMSKLRMETLPGEGKYIENVSYFVANSQKTKALLDETFFNNDKSETSVEKRVEYKIEVLNATSTSGLAAKVAEKLKNAGYSVSKTGNYSTSKDEKTMIINRTNDSEYAKKIKSALGKGTIKNSEKAPNDADITVIVGSDY